MPLPKPGIKKTSMLQVHGATALWVDTASCELSGAFIHLISTVIPPSLLLGLRLGFYLPYCSSLPHLIRAKEMGNWQS